MILSVMSWYRLARSAKDLWAGAGRGMAVSAAGGRKLSFAWRTRHPPRTPPLTRPLRAPVGPGAEGKADVRLPGLRQRPLPVRAETAPRPGGKGGRLRVPRDSGGVGRGPRAARETPADTKPRSRPANKFERDRLPNGFVDHSAFDRCGSAAPRPARPDRTSPGIGGRARGLTIGTGINDQTRDQAGARLYLRGA